MAGTTTSPGGFFFGSRPVCSFGVGEQRTQQGVGEGRFVRAFFCGKWMAQFRVLETAVEIGI